jgi:hypothetical protein
MQQVIKTILLVAMHPRSQAMHSFKMLPVAFGVNATLDIAMTLNIKTFSAITLSLPIKKFAQCSILV